MGLIPEEIIAELRERTDIVRVVGEYVALSKSGAQFRGLCPFHAEKTPSFFVYPEKRFFICYGCGKKGDVIRFLMEQQGRGFLDVVRELAEQAGVALPTASSETQPGARVRSERERLLKVNETAAQFFRSLYLGPQGAHARAYIAERGISDEIAGSFRIGYAPPSGEALWHHLQKQKVPAALGEAAGLIAPSSHGPGYYDRFRDRVIFPVLGLRGEVLGFSGRVLDPESKAAKYVNSPETPVYRKGELLYGIHVAKAAMRQKGRAVLVEGNFDVVQLHQHGFEEAVAPLGTALTPKQAELLRRLLGDGHVVVFFDGDDAGRKATQRALQLLLGEGIEVRVARCPKGHDPDSLARGGGTDQIGRLVEHAMPAVEYLIEEACAEFSDTVEGRVKALRWLAPTLRQVKDPTTRELYIGRVAAALSLQQRQVERAMRFAAVEAEQLQRGTAVKKEAKAAGRPSPALEREIRLLELLSDYPELRSEAGGLESLLTEEPVRTAYQALMAASGSALLDEVIVTALPEELQGLFAERLLVGSFRQEGLGLAEARQTLQEIVGALKRQAELGDIQAIDRAMAAAEREGNEEERRRLAIVKLELLRRRHGTSGQ